MGATTGIEEVLSSFRTVLQELCVPARIAVGNTAGFLAATGSTSPTTGSVTSKERRQPPLDR